jgi:hypothetical protein
MQLGPRISKRQKAQALPTKAGHDGSSVRKLDKKAKAGRITSVIATAAQIQGIR